MNHNTTRKHVALEGRSAGLGIALSMIASFFKFSIRQDFAVTGEIGDRGDVKIVYQIWKKIESCIKNETDFKRILIPYAEANHPEMKEVIKKLTSLQDQLCSQHQEVILCSSLLEALVYATTVNSFKKFFKRTKQQIDENCFAMRALNLADTSVQTQGRVFGLKNKIEDEIQNKTQIIFSETERINFKAQVDYYRQRGEEIPDHLYEKYQLVKQKIDELETS